MPRSLTARTILAGLVWATLALGAGGWLLMDVFNGVVLRQFDSRLSADMELLSAAIAASSDDPSERMTNADYQRVYSGSYWQAVPHEGPGFRSRSLWDSELPVPVADARLDAYNLTGPDNRPIRLMARVVTATNGENWTVAVAREQSALQMDIALFRRALCVTAIGMALLLIVAAFLLLRAAMSPLDRLRVAVRNRQTQAGRIVGRYPSEVAPLVDDLNALLARNERLREKGRLQAANLAHALKTPAAILANEVQKAERGHPIDTRLSAKAVDNIAAAAERHLSLARAAPEDTAAPEVTDAVPVARDVVRAIGRLFPDISFDIVAAPSVLAHIGRADLMEVLGNVIDNAGKWAKRRVVLKISRYNDFAEIMIEDDGPGIPTALVRRVLQQGVQLDTSRRGSGLGLTIVSDIMDRNHGCLSLGRSRLGGLRVAVRLPAAKYSASEDLKIDAF